MSNNATRQHYDIATGGSPKATPSKGTGTPGFKRGGTVRKQGGGSVYRKGGKAGK